MPASSRGGCRQGCEGVFEQYVPRLEQRYRGENLPRLFEKVEGQPLFTTRARPGRDGWFYRLTGYGWQEFVGR